MIEWELKALERHLILERWGGTRTVGWGNGQMWMSIKRGQPRKGKKTFKHDIQTTSSDTARFQETSPILKCAFWKYWKSCNDWRFESWPSWPIRHQHSLFGEEQQVESLNIVRSYWLVPGHGRDVWCSPYRASSAATDWLNFASLHHWKFKLDGENFFPAVTSKTINMMVLPAVPLFLFISFYFCLIVIKWHRLPKLPNKVASPTLFSVQRFCAVFQRW